MGTSTLDEQFDKALDEYDAGTGSWEEVIRSWNQYAIAEGEWGGIPWPDESQGIVLNSSNPFTGLEGFTQESAKRSQSIKKMAYYRWENAGKPDDCDVQFWLEAEQEYDSNPDNPGVPYKETCVLVNHWYSKTLQSDVSIWEDEISGKRKHNVQPINWDRRLEMVVSTMSVANVWALEAEEAALKKLRTMISEENYKKYVLTGCFFEISKHSGIGYMFRKGRPTLCFRPPRNEIFVALCNHATGFYNQTFAGVLPPTDEVIAHLLRMRHDEYNFWKQSNQHPPHSVLAGI